MNESARNESRVSRQTITAKAAESKKTPVVKICTREGCEKAVRAKGLCSTHYSQYRRANYDIPECSVQGCNKQAHSAGLCPAHLHAKNEYGDPLLRKSLDGVSETCLFNDGSGQCGFSTEAGGRSLCRKHYQKLYRIADNIESGKFTSDADRQLLADHWGYKVTDRGSRKDKA